jgi:hypothetical protein
MERDAELDAAYHHYFAAHFRQALCPRRVRPNPDLLIPIPHSGQISPTKHQIVSERDGGICYLCRLPTEGSGETPRAPTVDHVIPQAQGGSHDLANLRLAHRQCNFAKARQPHYLTIFERDHWRCRRCQQPISPDEAGWDYWTRPIVEHGFPLTAGELWLPDYAWSVHDRCRCMWTRDGTFQGTATPSGK